jgi:ferredoxin
VDLFLGGRSNQYNEYLVKTYYPSHYQQWHGFLIQYASETGKDDPKEYVSSGAWKKRVGTTGKQNVATVRKVPCLKNINAMHFILNTKVTENFIDRFKPFGKIETFSSELGKGFLVKDEAGDMPLFAVKVVEDTSLLLKESSIDPSWKLGEEFLCVDILATRNHRYLLQAIERQIRKFQACVLCGACIGVCPTNAITINPHFRVSEDKCSHCRNCVNTRYLRDSCVALHAKQQTRRYRDGNWI